jgi:hypothetical protein
MLDGMSSSHILERAVRYELLLQSSEPGAPYAEDRVRARLEARGLTFAADGAASWELKAGRADVRPLREGGLLIATEIGVPLTEKPDLMRQVLAEACAVAEEAQVRVLDPQLARAVSIKDDGAVSDQYLRTAKYAGEMLGVSEALGASFVPAQTGLKPGTKVVLVMAGLCVLLYFIATHVLG